MKKLLLVATLQSHIGQFHKPLMQLLKENGWEIHVAARDNLAEKDGLQLEYPDRVFNLPFQRSPLDRRNAEAYLRLKRILAEGEYDVVHCNTPIGGALARLAARPYRKNGTKVYYTAHGFHFYQGAPLKNWLAYPVEKYLSRFTDRLVTINEEDYLFACRKMHCPVFRIHGVGVDSRTYRPVSLEEQEQLRKELGLSGKILLNVGELLPNKNQQTAILALKQIRKKHPETSLLIAGDGPEREKLESLARKENLKERVLFLGYTRQLVRYMQACDLVVACSFREGLPLNVLEAMLCGKPVVASRSRGHRELVRDGLNGFLAEPENADDYAEKVCRILEGTKDYSEDAVRCAEPYRDSNVKEELRMLYFGEGQK